MRNNNRRRWINYHATRRKDEQDTEVATKIQAWSEMIRERDWSVKRDHRIQERHWATIVFWHAILSYHALHCIENGYQDFEAGGRTSERTRSINSRGQENFWYWGNTSSSWCNWLRHLSTGNTWRNHISQPVTADTFSLTTIHWRRSQKKYATPST